MKKSPKHPLLRSRAKSKWFSWESSQPAKHLYSCALYM